ncbi:RHS repeat-associated core domain-containing protein [Chryseobacterium indologenes]|uniref:RHS repeat domain-containing protein n=1 Tax=Chryseobacterium indologenes TaxID=253 RepID=UPI0030179FF2
MGVLEFVDVNDYYPFGMNHLRTGSSFLGPSSFKNYKFLGKELQESGFYDLGVRFYIPDIARFNAHDPLSEMTLDPYGYAYNNPLYYSDATGLRSDPINGGMEIGGPQGLDGPGEDPKPNELGGANKPYQIPTIDLKAPIRAMASNPASIMPSYCSVCYSGNGMSSGITLSAPQIRNVQPTFIYRGPENGQGGGLVMMDSMWEVLGIVASNMKPENQEAALGLAAIAIITTKGRAAPAIIKAEIGAEKGAVLGSSISTNYKSTFFSAYPELKGTVVVHHAVEQQALKRYPGLLTESEMHSLENLRGIPKTINSDVHLSQIRKIWNKFYKENANPTKQQILDQATIIDQKFGTQFTPPVK